MRIKIQFYPKPNLVTVDSNNIWSKYSQDSTLKEIECISASFSPVIEMVITQCNKAKLVLNAIYFSIAEIFNLLIYLQKNGIITKNTNEANIFALFSRTNGLQIISTYKGFLYENSSFTINQNNSTEYLHGFLEYTLNSSKIKISKALDYPEGTANIVICAPRKLYQSLNTSKNFTNDPKIKIIDNIKLVRYSDLNKNKGLQIYADSVLLNFSTKLSKVFQEDIYKLQATTAKINFLSLISKILCLLILVFLILLFYKYHQFHNLTQQLQDENVNYLSDYSKKKKQLQQKYPQINTELYLTEKLIAKSLPHGEKVLSILDEYTNQNNVNIVKFGWENKSSDGMHNEINIHSTILLKHNYDKKQFIDNKSLHLHLESYYSTLTKEFNKLGYKCNFSINYDGIITTPDNIIITTKINLTYVNLQ